MKRIFIGLALMAAVMSCQKQSYESAPMDTREISFSVEGLDFDVKTKAAAVTELSTFGVIAENTNTPAQEWALASVTKSGTSYNTGKYWPATDMKYAFYASNASLSYATTGTTVSPTDAETDVVVAYSAYSALNYKTSIPLTFNHIFSRIGNVTISAPEGYSISVSSIKVNSPVSGTYNIKTGEWSAKGSAVEKNLSEGANDVYVVPGTYTVSVSYTLTKGDYVQSFTKTGNVTLSQGNINSISATPTVESGEGAENIVFTVTLTPWGNDSHNITLS